MDQKREVGERSLSEEGKIEFDRSPEKMKEVHDDDDLKANLQVAGPIPVAAWLIIVSKSRFPPSRLLPFAEVRRQEH